MRPDPKTATFAFSGDVVEADKFDIRLLWVDATRRHVVEQRSFMLVCKELIGDFNTSEQ